MHIEGFNNEYNNEATKQNVKKSDVSGNDVFCNIFDALDDGDGILDNKEITKTISLFSKIAESNKNGANDTIEDKELDTARTKYKNFSNLKLSANDLKQFILKFCEINSQKLKEDFNNEAAEFCKQTGREFLSNTSQLAKKKDEKGNEVVVLLYKNNKNKMAAQYVNGSYSFYNKTGFYEFIRDIKTSNGEVIAKKGLYDNNGNLICGGEKYSESNQYIELLAKAQNLKQTENAGVYKDDQDKTYIFSSNREFEEVKKEDTVFYDKDLYICRKKRYRSRHDKNDFYMEDIVFYNNKFYPNEAECYIDKKGLNITIKKDANGNNIYVDKNNPKVVYEYYGNGEFILSEDSIVNKTKNMKVNGKIDDDIYQRSIGDCYYVSTLQGLGDLLGSDIIKKDNENFIITFPGLGKGSKKNSIAGKNPKIAAINNKVIQSLKKEYIVTQQELNEAIEQAGQQSLLGDPDAILIELAYKKFRINLVNALRKEYRAGLSANIPDSKICKLNNDFNRNNPEYQLSHDAFLATSEDGESLNLSVLNGGCEKSIISLLMPEGIEIITKKPDSQESASEIINNYSSDNYRIFASFDMEDYSHVVSYDLENKRFRLTYDPNLNESELNTEDKMNNKITSITIVKIPDNKKDPNKFSI